MGRSLLFAACMLGLIALPGCVSCENEVSQTGLSPSGKLKAVVFNRGCGATTGFNTQVSILGTNRSLPSEGGNVLILDGTVPLRVQWQSELALNVSGLGTAETFKQERVATGASITYGK